MAGHVPEYLTSKFVTRGSVSQDKQTGTFNNFLFLKLEQDRKPFTMEVNLTGKS